MIIRGDSIKKQLILISFITVISLILGIGYAEVANIELKVNGNAKLSKQTGIVITDVTLNNVNNADQELSQINAFYQTILNTKIVLDNIYNSEISYTVKMKNLDSTKKVFKEITYDNNFYDNDDIKVELENINYNDIIEEKSEISFNLIYKYKTIKNNYENNTLNSIINFKFEDYIDN